jgi:membrane protein YdbS with pleckstrin-like domain
MLMYRRLTRRFYPRVGRTLQNGLTSPFAWACALVPAGWAVIFYNNTPALVLGFVISIALYWVVYLRLTQFRWCFAPRALKSKRQEELA